MTIPASVFDALSALITYPGANFVQEAGDHARTVIDALPGTEEGIDSYLRFVAEQPVSDLEERYTKTFDCSPTHSLEVGWHVFGENYSRGAFLVHMRQLMKKMGIEESPELPDHLTHVLRVLGRLDSEEAGELAATTVAPAVRTVRDALARDGSVFHGVLDAISQAVDTRIPDGVTLDPTPVEPFRPPDLLPGQGFESWSCPDPAAQVSSAANPEADCSIGCPLPDMFKGECR